MPCAFLSFANGQEDSAYAATDPYAVDEESPGLRAAYADSAPDPVPGPAPAESLLNLPEARVHASRGLAAVRPPGSEPRALGAADLERGVSAFGDPARIARYLPGAGRGNDWETELIVRGGSPDQSGFLVDGIPLARVSHYEGFRGEHGGIGILNLEFADSVLFHAGTFPARFPDRLSGLVEVRYRDGDTAAAHERLTTDITGAGLAAEGPLPGSKGSYAAASRYSAMNLLVRTRMVQAFGVPSYFNGQARVTVPIGGARLRGSFIGGSEEWSNRIGSGSKLDLTGHSLASSLSLEAKGRSGHARAELLYEERGQRIAFANWGRNPGSGSDNFTRLEDGRERKWGAALERFASPRPGWAFGFGASAQAATGAYRLRIGDQATYLAYQDTVIQLTQEIGSRETPQTNAAGFVEATWTAGKAELYAGYRHLYEQASDQHAPGPRLAVKFLPAPGQAVRAAFGLHSQPHAFADLSQRAEPVRARLPYMAQTEAGWEGSAGKGIAASLTVFAKEGYRLARETYSPLAAGYMAAYRDTGRTRARGAEAAFRTPRDGRWNLSAAYGYLWYREKGPDGKWGPGQYSLPHTANLAAGLRLARGLWLSGRYAIGSGTPYTPFDSVASGMAGTGVYLPDQAYSRRGAAYSRLDARVDWEYRLRNAQVSLFAEVENVLGRRNESGRQWNMVDGRETPIEGMGRLPVAGASVRF